MKIFPFLLIIITLNNTAIAKDLLCNKQSSTSIAWERYKLKWEVESKTESSTNEESTIKLMNIGKDMRSKKPKLLTKEGSVTLSEISDHSDRSTYLEQAPGSMIIFWTFIPASTKNGIMFDTVISTKSYVVAGPTTNTTVYACENSEKARKP